MSQNPNSEEKLEYIYQTLKKQESRRVWGILSKWGFRLFILIYLYYFITVGLPNMMGNMMPEIAIGSGGLDSVKSYFGKYMIK